MEPDNTVHMECNDHMEKEFNGNMSTEFNDNVYMKSYCGTGTKSDGNKATESDSNKDTESDDNKNTESDGNKNTESDGNKNTESDGNKNMESEGNKDTESDGNKDSESDNSTNTESDNSTDTESDDSKNWESNNNTDLESDGNKDTESDNSTDTESDDSKNWESNNNTDLESDGNKDTESDNSTDTESNDSINTESNSNTDSEFDDNTDTESDDNTDTEFDDNIQTESYDFVNMKHNTYRKYNNHNPETLISLCLNCIIKYFETFMAAYFCAKGEDLKVFEFLQRSYSTTLLKESLNRYDINSYVKFLCNRHLTNVDIKDLLRFNYKVLLHGLKEVKPDIKSLSLSSTKHSSSRFRQEYSHFLLELMPSIVNIETLTLNKIYITKDIIKYIRKNCRSLKQLDLMCENLSKNHLRALCGKDEMFPNESDTLQYLNLSYENLTPLDVAYVLKNLKNLIALNCDDIVDIIYYLYKKDMKNKSGVCSETYNLEELTIPDIGDYSIEAIEICALLCPKIKKLTVYKIQSQSQMNVLTKFSKPKDVTLSMPSTKEINLSTFFEAKGQHLQILHVRGGSVPVNCLLQFCPNLKYLELDANHFPMEKIETLLPLQYLKHLKFKRLKFRKLESIKSILLHCPNLEKLSFCLIKSFTDEFVHSITSCPCMYNLKELELEYSRCTFSVIKKLKLKIPNPEVFKITHCYIPDKIDTLRSFEN